MSAGVEVSVDLVRASGGMTVYCSVKNFLASEVTLPELFAQLRKDLMQAAEAAATFEPAAVPSRATAQVGIDVNDANPWINFSILNPRRFLANFDEYLTRLQGLTATTLTAWELPKGFVGGRNA